MKPLKRNRALAVEPPEDLTLTAMRLVDGLRGGRHLALRTGDADEFYDYKPYAPGDPISRVDWRAAARRDELHLRRRRHQAPMTVAILVDASESMAFRSLHDQPWPTKLRAAQQLAAALAVIALRQGDRVALRSGSAASTATLTGREGLGVFIRTLESIQPSGETSLTTLLTDAAAALPEADLIIALSDALDDVETLSEAMIRAVHQSRAARELMLIQVLSEDELAPAPRGATLVDPESDASTAIEDAVAAERAARLVATHVERVRAITTHTRGRYALHRTSQSGAETLRHVLQARV